MLGAGAVVPRAYEGLTKERQETYDSGAQDTDQAASAAQPVQRNCISVKNSVSEDV